MALYIDSAYLDDIITVNNVLPVAGITTNPSILLAARERGQNLAPQALLTQLLQLSNGSVFVQPSIADEERAIQDALTSLEAAPGRVIIKIPMIPIGMRVAQRLKAQGHPIAFTAVTTVAQAYLATLLQAEFVIPYYNRLQRNGVAADERVAQMVSMIHLQASSTRILVASIKSVAEAEQALLVGAHDLTIPPQILLDMVSDPQTDNAVTKFEQDSEKMRTLS